MSASVLTRFVAKPARIISTLYKKNKPLHLTSYTKKVETVEDWVDVWALSISIQRCKHGTRLYIRTRVNRALNCQNFNIRRSEFRLFTQYMLAKLISTQSANGAKYIYVQPMSCLTQDLWLKLCNSVENKLTVNNT